MQALSTTSWKLVYRSVLLNTEKEDLPSRIALAERAIVFCRRELLVNAPARIDERDDLDDALYTLQGWKHARVETEPAA